MVDMAMNTPASQQSHPYRQCTNVASGRLFDSAVISPASAMAATGDVLHQAANVESGLPSSALHLQPQQLDDGDVHNLATAPVAPSISNDGLSLSTLVPEQLHTLKVEMAWLKKQLAEKANEVQTRDGVIEALLNEQANVSHLKEELSTALHEIETLKKTISDDKQGQCVICWEGTPCFALVPCGHIVLCQRCNGRSVEQCPVCRRKVVTSLRVYKP
mmetsp:Transcript_103655/g.200866  ORF Transcript_103655/g.200866 Transcript_103655/m.200866 type:complete len:217 (-) Transcript_103655:65-715(-)